MLICYRRDLSKLNKKGNRKVNKASSTGSIDRSTRVRRIKRVLIGLVFIAILLPTVLCVLLFVKMNKMEQQINELSLKREQYSVVNMDTTYVVANASEPSSNDIVSATVVNEDLDEVDETKEEILVDDDEDVLEEVTAEENADITLKRVYLTFDDGPSSNTAKILDILKEYGVKGTFFVNGKESDTLTPLYKRIVDEGHQIGMHSYTHRYSEVYANEDAFIYDLDRIQAYIYEQTGVLSKIYRFPGGASNTVSKTPVSQFADILDSRGIKYYDWNVVSGDTTSTYGIPADSIIRNIINGSLNQEDAIVLMHDLPEKDTTVDALPTVIEKFLEMGVEILPIDENTIEYHQPFAM